MFTTTQSSSVSVPFVSLPTQNNALLGEAALLEKMQDRRRRRVGYADPPLRKVGLQVRVLALPQP